MKKRKTIGYISLAFLVITLAGCGYTKEEKADMKRYEAQGRENAKDYIKEKYGVDVKIREVTCEKYNSGPIPDFSPSPTGNVFVRMSAQGEDFSVFISGESRNADGIDNYQYQEIVGTFTQELEKITGLSAKSVFICYGEFQTVNAEKNGMIHDFYNGGNLAEILQGGSARAVASYINQPVEQIPVSEISRMTGVQTILFADYESQEAYQAVSQPYYNLTGWPIENGIEDQLYQINGYRVVSAGEDYSMNCEKKIQDDIILITEKPEEQVKLEKTILDPQENWNGNGFLDAEQVADAYTVETNARKVYVYFPVEKLQTKDVKRTQLVKQYQYRGETCYDTIPGGVTDDGRYISGIAYTKDESEIKLSVFVDKK